MSNETPHRSRALSSKGRDTRPARARHRVGEPRLCEPRMRAVALESRLKPDMKAGLSSHDRSNRCPQRGHSAFYTFRSAIVHTRPASRWLAGSRRAMARVLPERALGGRTKRGTRRGLFSLGTLLCAAEQAPANGEPDDDDRAAIDAGRRSEKDAQTAGSATTAPRVEGLCQAFALSPTRHNRPRHKAPALRFGPIWL
jgi:hypothetical protein